MVHVWHIIHYLMLQSTDIEHMIKCRVDKEIDKFRCSISSIISAQFSADVTTAKPWHTAGN